MLRLFFLLLTVVIISSSDVVADETALTPIPILVENAKKSLAEKDEKTYESLHNQLFERLTGLSATATELPKGLSQAGFQKRLCPFRKATVSLITPSRVQALHHQMRIMAFEVVKDKEENAPYVRAIIDCVQDNGEPVPDAKALREGLSWAKKLHAANIEGVHAMGREYESLVERYPENIFYDVLNMSIDGRIRDIRREEERQERKKRYPEGIRFQSTLVAKAHKGDLAAQLKVARRLEIGNNFRQDNAMAYFWYKRALQNGGGEAAQTGMDRLFPHLSVGDFLSIDIWTEEGHRPY